MSGIPQPSASVALALASIAVHAEELASIDGSPAFDGPAIHGALALPGVRDYLDQLDELGLLPKKRTAEPGLA